MKLSIITINFNNLHGLIKTVNSVLDQVSKNFEYIIIDGGSTDGSADYISENKKYFSYSISEPDKGIYNAMNKGINNATGEYLLFLNSGDYLFDKNVLHNIFSKNIDSDIIFGNLVKDFSGNFYIEKGPQNNNITFLTFWKGSINHPSSFIKRVLFEKIGKYDENYKIISDWIFFLNAIIFHNVSVSYIDSNITIFDTNGLSHTHIEVAKNERLAALGRYFPKKILDDYDLFSKIDVHKFLRLKTKWYYKFFNLIFSKNNNF